MDYPAGSFMWSGNSSSENYSFIDGSVESYAEEGTIAPSGYFLGTRSDHSLEIMECERNPNMLANGSLTYNTQTHPLSGQILSKDELPNSLLELQQLENNSNLQSSSIPQGVLQCSSTPGTFEVKLDRPGLAELPHALSSSIDSNGSEISAFLADVHAVSSASTLCPTFQNVSSFMEPVNLEAFNFQGAQNAAMLNKTSHPNGSPLLFDNAAMAPLHDSKEFINVGAISSFSTVQQAQLAAGGLKPQQQEQNVCTISLPAFTSGSRLAVTDAQGPLIPSKITPLIHDNKSEYPINHSSDVEPQANSALGNSASVKPRVRARRGQATDPHSIAERLRREKISERMKNLQDLVPNSNKADKASMLDEIIDYVKFLQLQVKVLSMSRLGAPGAVLPLLRESQTEGSNPPLSAPTISQGLLDIADSEDRFTFEQEVVKLMETSITSAMQYLQNKGLCLMPIALASAISNKKGMAAAAIPPER